MTPALDSIVKHFKIGGTYLGGRPYGSGHIHDTFLILTEEDDAPDYLLQKINHQVFRNVPHLMSNIRKVTEHIQEKISRHPERKASTKCLNFIPARDGKYYYQDSDGSYWRAVVFIPNSHSYDTVRSPKMAYAGGKTFGRFLALLSDLPPESLHETIPDFHHAEKRLEMFFKTVKENRGGRTEHVPQEIELIKDHAEEMTWLSRLGREESIPKRVTHNDTKFNNILFDSSGNPLCVIDLDTVMPGYIYYDFGDAVRTATNTGAEDEKDLSKVNMDMALFEALSRGFMEETRIFLTETEVEYLAFGAKLLTFMIGLRFLTDFLDGDKYFKVKHPSQNLQRARAQFKLLSSMDDQYSEMQAVIHKLKGGARR